MDIIAEVRNRHFVSNESISSIAHLMGVSRLIPILFRNGINNPFPSGNAVHGFRI